MARSFRLLRGHHLMELLTGKRHCGGRKPQPGKRNPARSPGLRTSGKLVESPARGGGSRRVLCAAHMRVGLDRPSREHGALRQHARRGTTRSHAPVAGTGRRHLQQPQLLRPILSANHTGIMDGRRQRHRGALCTCHAGRGKSIRLLSRSRK